MTFVRLIFRKAAIHAALIVAAIVASGCSDLCANEELAQYASPSGDLKAVVFQRNCGVGSGAVIQGSILKSGKVLGNDSGNLFAVDENSLAKPTIEWIGSREIEISNVRESDIRFLDNRPYGVTVTVKKKR